MVVSVIGMEKELLTAPIPSMRKKGMKMLDAGLLIIIMVIIVGNNHLTAPMASMRKRGSREQAQATDLQSVRKPSRYAWGEQCDYQHTCKKRVMLQ